MESVKTMIKSTRIWNYTARNSVFFFKPLIKYLITAINVKCLFVYKKTLFTYFLFLVIMFFDIP